MAMTRLPGASTSAVAQRLDLEIVKGVPLRETQLEDGDRLVGPGHDGAPPLKDLHGDGGATATAMQQLPRPEEVLVGVVAAPDALDRQAEDSRGNPGLAAAGPKTPCLPVRYPRSEPDTTGEAGRPAHHQPKSRPPGDCAPTPGSSPPGGEVTPS